MKWRHPGKAGAALYALVAAVFGIGVGLFSRLQVVRQRGRSRVAKSLPPGGVIVISNHTSYADGLLLIVACRRMGRSLRMLATAGVFRAPLVGTVARRLGFIPVQRGTAQASEALDQAVVALRAGEAVGMYPEGRVTRDPNLWPERAKTGTVRLAVASGAPIVPVAMVGADRVVPRRRPLRGLLTALIRRPRVRTRVGEAIDVVAMIGSEPTPQQIRAASDEVMASLVALVGELRGELAPSPVGVERVGE